MVDVDQLIAGVLAREGGYTHDPADPGGATNFGITQTVARAYGYVGDMQALPKATAVEIYRKRYWTVPGFDKIAALMPSVAAEMFDAGVNMGPATAGQFLQRALNVLNQQERLYHDVVVDGACGALTLQALQGYRLARADAEGEAVLLWMVRALRTARYVTIAEGNPTSEKFEYGWVARQARGG